MPPSVRTPEDLEHRLRLVDGGLSTALERRGAVLTHPLWTARFLLEDPERIVQAHLDYLEAGAELIITSSYQASAPGFGAVAGLDAAASHDVIRLTSDLAFEARRRHGREDVLVVASVGPYGAVLGDGSEYRGDYTVDRPALVEFHRDRVVTLASTGVDLLACETIPSTVEAGVLVEVLADVPDARGWLCFSCRDGATTCGGEPIELAAAVAASSPQILAIGVNCTAPEHVEELLRRIATVTDLPLVAYPNSGQRWDADAKSWHGAVVDVSDGGHVERWQLAGARLIGGCCGVGPAEIRTLAHALGRV